MDGLHPGWPAYPSSIIQTFFLRDVLSHFVLVFLLLFFLLRYVKNELQYIAYKSADHFFIVIWSLQDIKTNAMFLNALKTCAQTHTVTHEHRLTSTAFRWVLEEDLSSPVLTAALSGGEGGFLQLLF